MVNRYTNPPLTVLRRFSANVSHRLTTEQRFESKDFFKLVKIIVFVQEATLSQLPLRSSPRPISIGQLHTLPCFHLRPINLIVFEGSYYLTIWDTLS